MSTDEKYMQFALEQVMKAQRRSTGIALIFLNLVARSDGWSTPRPGPFTPRKETWYPLCRKLVETHRRSGRGLKISSPLVFDPRTIHLLAD